MSNDVNRFWVHVSCFGEGNLFALYPKLLEQMITKTKSSYHGPPEFDILLPSNYEWKTKIYYQLVEKQRQISQMPQPSSVPIWPRPASVWDTTLRQPPMKRPRRRLTLSTKATSKDSVSSSVTPVTWTVSDIAKAACLLNQPPLPNEFLDEHEMRRVFSLIYDVFRYKNVLNQALLDVAFFYLFPELCEKNYLLWLLLYDLYHRRFVEREQSDVEASERLFPGCGLSEGEAALWATRVRLAAALSRLRIANSALRLSDMLPSHLKDERVVRVAQRAPVTCWVNKNHVSGKSPDHLFDEVKNTLHLKMLSNKSSTLSCEEFRWDPLCPMFLAFHHSQRENLVQSEFVRKGILIIQNRSFCLGPAAFCKLLCKHNLTGSVIQTHVNSPRATAYLATLLSENDQIFTLLLFGAGSKKSEYEEYFNKLNIKNIIVFSKKLFEMEPNVEILEPVVGVFATPPNSYSAVNDPIDLVCSRGGDLSMLEILTDTNDSAESQKRVANILEEQRLTLRFAMSRPQIQFVLYETHSQLSAENGDMVNQVLNEVNEAAKYKHAELQGKINESLLSTIKSGVIATEHQEINNNVTANKMKLDNIIEIKESDESLDTEESIDIESLLKDVEVPACDSFEECRVPDLCFNYDRCFNLDSEGCYLSLLQRKEISRFDAKYMIKMAETRGLFACTNQESVSKTKLQKTAKQRKPEATKPTPAKKKRKTFEVERISAQTHASMMRSCPHSLRTEKGELPQRCCPKHSQKTESNISPARLWWAETTRYLTNLRRSLIKQKLLSANKETLPKQQEKILRDINNIDEILFRSEKKKGANIPVFPKLRLSRSPVRVEREPFPITVNVVQLSSSSLIIDEI